MLAEYLIFACQENISFALLSLSLLGDDITMSVWEREVIRSTRIDCSPYQNPRNDQNCSKQSNGAKQLINVFHSIRAHSPAIFPAFTLMYCRDAQPGGALSSQLACSPVIGIRAVRMGFLYID